MLVVATLLKQDTDLKIFEGDNFVSSESDSLSLATNRFDDQSPEKQKDIKGNMEGMLGAFGDILVFAHNISILTGSEEALEILKMDLDKLQRQMLELMNEIHES